MKHYSFENEGRVDCRPEILQETSSTTQKRSKSLDDLFFLDPFGYLERHGVDLEGLRHSPSLTNVVNVFIPVLPDKYQRDVRKISGVLALLDTGEHDDLANDIASSFFEAYDAYKEQKNKSN